MRTWFTYTGVWNCIYRMLNGSSLWVPSTCCSGYETWNFVIFVSSYIKEHDDVIRWKHFPRYWPFVRGIHRSPVNSPHKGQWRGALMFSLICAWINDWVNNRESGDLRRHRADYDVIVMIVCEECCATTKYQGQGKVSTPHSIFGCIYLPQPRYLWPLLLAWTNFNPSMDK